MLTYALIAVILSLLIGLFAIVFPITFMEIGKLRRNFTIIGMRLW